MRRRARWIELQSATRFLRAAFLVRHVVDAYLAIKLVHVLAVILLVGILPVEYLLVRRVMAARDPPRVGKLLGDLDWVETRIALPASALLLLSGLAMTLGPYKRWPLFGEPWFATVALGLFVVLMGIEAVVLPARYKAIRAWAEAGAAGDMPGRDWQAWSLLGLALAIAAVFVTVLKPF